MCSLSTNQDVGKNDELRKTIAVVDDDISVRASLARILQSAGFHVESYRAAQAFLDAGAADVVDLLILDYHMPGKNGLELQRELLADQKTIPMVMISGDENENVRDEAIENGAIAFLPKPANSEQLLEVIQRALDNYEAR